MPNLRSLLAFSVLIIPLLATGRAETPNIQLLRTPNDGIQPQAAVDSKGVVHLIYFKGEPAGGDISYVRREPGQKEFSKPVQVNTQPHTAIAIGTIRGAQLAIGKNGRVHVVWDGMGKGVSTAPHSAHAQDALRSDAPTPHAHSAHDDSQRKPLFYTRLNEAGTAFEPERNIITYAYGLDGGSSVAADFDGNVYVAWHAPIPGSTNGEASRAVFVARSSDEGKTFGRESLATSKPTGACACCGLRAFADNSGAVYILYRAATELTNRNETLLLSRDHGNTFDIAYSHPWRVSMCPMSSAFISQAPNDIIAAAETHGRVFLVRVDPKTGKTSAPLSPDTRAKYPVPVANSKGETLFVWAEDTAWNKSGSVAWQLFDRHDQPLSKKERADGLNPWSLPTAFAEASGNFSIIY